jgi:murein DD-endopeptidase MepM/ murein hydrolase activator NlpD
MLVPERDKGVRSLRIPRILFRAMTVLCFLTLGLIAILLFDYWKILQQVHEKKHLTIENRQLREQIQLNQMKINAVTEDIERIRTFERKLRIITGLQEVDLSTEARQTLNLEIQTRTPKSIETRSETPQEKTPTLRERLRNLPLSSDYLDLKDLYEKKIATSFGLQTGYVYTKEWSDLFASSFALAESFARFDYTFNLVKRDVTSLEVAVHELDQYLLDKESYLRSMPTLMPALGWITSYYGPRISPTSGQLRMHEGLDIGATPGTPIVTPADGIVTFSGTKPGFGNFVQIDHGYGLETLYAHAKSLSASKGQRVIRGDLIATVGSTGFSTGPHLHYEVRVNGTPVDPLYFILD